MQTHHPPVNPLHDPTQTDLASYTYSVFELGRCVGVLPLRDDDLVPLVR